jgi:hypothetical protein
MGKWQPKNAPSAKTVWAYRRQDECGFKLCITRKKPPLKAASPQGQEV